MQAATGVFLSYILLSFLIIVFNKKIGKWYYKFVLFYTDKLDLKGLFVFKVNYKNRDSLMFAMRVFLIAFSTFIILFSIYELLV